MNFWIVESEIYANTWFLFRENGQEVKIVIKGIEIIGSHHLEPWELKHFEINYLKLNEVKGELMKAG